MLPIELLDNLCCPPGYIIVERDETKKTYGRIIIPPSVHRNKKAMTATVILVGVGYNPDDIRTADRVLLSSGIGKTIVFGEDELTYYVCRLSEIEAKIEGDSDVDYADIGRQDFAPYFPKAFEMAEDGKAEDGDLVGEPT